MKNAYFFLAGLHAILPHCHCSWRFGKQVILFLFLLFFPSSSFFFFVMLIFAYDHQFYIFSVQHLVVAIVTYFTSKEVSQS